MTLTKEELERYSRQIVIEEIGLEGQEKIKNTSVCVVGVGGLGCVSALQLAAMGVGRLRLVDHDVVDITNLHRQLLYDTSLLGYPKVEAAKTRLNSLNPSVEIEPVSYTVNSHTAESVVKGVDIVVDGLDHLGPRYAINKACVKFGIPYVFGAAIGAYGNVSTIIPKKTACLECILGVISDEGIPTCETVGVLPSILGIIASIQVRETISLIVGADPSLANKFLFCNLNSMNFESFSVARASDCQTCGRGVAQAAPEELRAVQLCGKNSFMVSPKRVISLDINKAAKAIGAKFNLKIKGYIGITFDCAENISVSLMKTGNMLIKGVSKEKDALRLYDEIIQIIQ